MNSKRVLRILSAAAILALSTSRLYANPVVPGGPFMLPDVFPAPSSSPPFLYTASGGYNFSSGADFVVGTWNEFVFNDIFGVTCPTCLDFAFVVTANSATLGIERVGMPVPLSISTDAGYIANAGGVIDPILVNRGPLGSTSFFFAPGFSFGGTSRFLVIATDATTFGPDQLGFDAINSNGFIIGGIGAVTIGVVGPRAAVPEPDTLWLFAAGFAGLAGSKLRSKGLLFA